MLPTTVQGPEGGHLMLNRTETLRTNPTSFVCNGVCCRARPVPGEECTQETGSEK